jgi:catalase-peroxidase
MKKQKLSIISAVAVLLIVSCSKSHDYKNDGKKFHSEIKNNDFWWPKIINLNPLRANSQANIPLEKDFNYAKEFAKLDLNSVKKDIKKVITTSQDWWPADYGNYGPFFIRLAWHSAGTYRTTDGRGGGDGGQIRFEPLNSWPDNANLDKARRLLWPIKKKYGNQLSWSDLIILTGNVSLEVMGFKTIGFAGGRADDWEAEIVNWGPEHKFLASKRHDKKGNLKKPLGATHMGLIYVNPEGPLGRPDPLASAKDIRETFARMAMNDEETVALIAGGHTFGKMHGAHKPDKCIGVEPAGAKIEKQGLGWENKCGKGYGVDTVTSGLEGAWTANPTEFTMQYLENLFAFNWKKTKSNGGAIQWIPDDESAKNLVPDAHDPNKRHAPVMLTTDLALRFDPIYEKIARRYKDNPQEFEMAFAKAWFKLTHRDMGGISHYVGKDQPKEQFVWQDPIPKANYKMIDNADIANLKQQILNSGLSNSELIRTSWASASSYRNTDKRGGVNGGRIRLEPQKNWKINNPQELSRVINVLEKIQNKFNKNQNGKKVSFADLLVIGSAGAIEKSALAGGFKISVPVKIGRVDASQSQTDIESFAVLESKADGFRNYFSQENKSSPIDAMIEKAKLLNLTIPEMTVLVGGFRSLNINADSLQTGILTVNSKKLSNDFFVNLLDMDTVWEKSSKEGLYEGKSRKDGKVKWSASPVDLMFGSSSELRAIAEYYAYDSNKKVFINDFVKAWNKVMNLDMTN